MGIFTNILCYSQDILCIPTYVREYFLTFHWVFKEFSLQSSNLNCDACSRNTFAQDPQGLAFLFPISDDLLCHLGFHPNTFISEIGHGLVLWRTVWLTQFGEYLFETIEKLVRYEHIHYNQ